MNRKKKKTSVIWCYEGRWVKIKVFLLSKRRLLLHSLSLRAAFLVAPNEVRGLLFCLSLGQMGDASLSLGMTG